MRRYDPIQLIARACIEDLKQGVERCQTCATQEKVGGSVGVGNLIFSEAKLDLPAQLELLFNTLCV